MTHDEGPTGVLAPIDPSPRITVVVPHYNDLEALDKCLTSLVEQAPTHGGREIIVCDNASPIDHAQIAAVVEGRARLVVELEKGAGPARNRAVSEARGEILAFIDSDCIAQPGWLESGIAALERGDLVGGRIDVFTTASRPSGADLFEQLFAFDQRGYIEDKGFTVTANLFCRRDTFSAVGPFANGVSEDLEWCRRARRTGFSLVYEDAAVVRHPTRPDWTSLQAKWRRLTREAFQLHRMEGGSRMGWALRQLAVAASAAPHTLRVLRADLPVGEKVRAAGGLWRIRTWRALEGLKLSLSAPR